MRTKTAEIISEKTGKSVDEIYEVTAEDIYYSAEEKLPEDEIGELISRALEY